MLRYVLLFGWMMVAVTLPAQPPDRPEILNFEEFQPRLEGHSDTTYVINFWATWCKPCVKELPHFERAYQEYQGQPVHFLLVSLDFSHQIESKLIPFLQKHALSPEVVVLDAPNPNAWIDLVHKDWSGSLPGTLVYQGSSRRFYERELEDYSELQEIIQSFIKKT